MPASKSNPIARLRSRATGESYQSALRAIRTGEPIITVPAPEQEQLEGLFLQKLAEFRWTAAELGGGRFGIKRVTAGERQIVLWLEDDSAITDLVTNIMPAKPDGSDELIGIPGLRSRQHRLGLSLYRPGIEAEVVIEGVDVQQWEDIHEGAFAVPHEQVHCAGRHKPHDWTPSERDFEQWRHRRFGHEALQREANENAMRSVVLRRIGLFNRLSSDGISTWSHIQRTGPVVEIFRPEEASIESFIQALTSARLSPQLELMEKDPIRPDGYIRLATQGNGSILEIRLVSPVRR